MSESNANQLRILIATDIHLGYNEKDPIRGGEIRSNYKLELHYFILDFIVVFLFILNQGMIALFHLKKYLPMLLQIKWTSFYLAEIYFMMQNHRQTRYTSISGKK